MNAAAQIFAEHHCPQCRRMKPAEEFRNHGWCYDCKRAYNRDRNARIKAGVWKPHVKRTPRDFPLPVAPPPAPTFRQPQPSDEAMLRIYLEAFMVEFGFTALKVTYTRLEGEIAKKHRLNLAREGWIA